jgi:site-specific DNA-adenine methylase
MEAKKMNLADNGELFSRDPAELSDQELLAMDWILHRAWAMLEASHQVYYDETLWEAKDILGLHIVVLREMSRRGYQHTIQDSLQEQTLPMLLDEETEDQTDEEDVEKGVRQAFGSYAGKRFLAHKIASFFPYHRIYCEPFAGGAAVLYAKDQSPKEIINDKDPTVAMMHRFVRDHTVEDRNALAKREWRILRETHERLKKMTPENERDKFYQAYYLTRSSYGKMRGRGFNQANEGVLIDFENNIRRAQERLRKVEIHNKDYQKVLEDYDSTETLYYLDPPYPETFNLKDLGFDEQEFLKTLKTLKAKWIVSYPFERAKYFKGYEVNVVKRRNMMRGAGGNQEWVKEILVSNFPLKPVHLYIQKDLIIEPLAEG